MTTNDASPVASTPDFRMRSDMHNAPRGKRVLLINESGVLTQGSLNAENMGHFIEWQYIPKRAIKEQL